MRIIKQKAGVFKYAFVFDFDQRLIVLCREMKAIFGSKQLMWKDNAWRFNNLFIATELQKRIPEILVDFSMYEDFVVHEENVRKKELRLKNVHILKGKKDTDFEVTGIKGELYPYQKIGVEFFINANGRAILADEPGTGKEHSCNTLVATPSSWKKIDKLKIGNYVIGRNGNKTKVTGIYPQGIKDLYRFTLTDGSSCLCGLEHLWNVKSNNDMTRKRNWKTITTKELLKRKILDKKGKAQYVIPFAEPVKFKKKKLLVKPYTLGALIGDGALTCSSVHISMPDDKIHVIDKIKKEYPQYTYYKQVYGDNCPRVSLTNNPVKKNNGIKQSIKKLGLNIKSPERFIPKKYKCGSIQQRLELLRGLMDTDGSARKNRISYSTMSYQLAKDVSYLVRSLRGDSNISKYDRTKDEKGIEYHVNVKLDIFCPFSDDSNKKKQWWPSTNRGKYGRRIKSIEYEKSGEAICIAVDATDKLYVVDDFIVTHNTVQSLAYITHTEQRKSLIICPASVKYNWEAEVKKWTKLKSFVIDAKDGISNEEWNGSDIIIINYDILKKYFDFLINKRIDCCVCDEHHFMKNAGAVRTKAAMAIARQSTSLLMLSATPLMNRTIELYTALNLMDPEKWNDWYSYTKRYCNGHMGDWGYECKGSSNLDELKQEIDHYFIRRRKQDVLKDLPEKVYIKIPVKLDSKTQKEYNILENNLVEYLRDVKKKENKEIAKSLQAEKLIKIGELRQLTTKGKVGAVKELIDSILESGEKAVIFSVYNEPIESLYESYKDLSVILTGKQSSSEKNIAATTFQADPEKKLFFGGLKSAGVGLTLTTATNVIFLDFSWIPADHIQGEDRIHRIGSVSNSVNIYQLFSKDTIDEYMVSLLAEKRKIFDKIIDGIDTNEVSSSNMFGDIMKHLENKGT